MQAFHKSDSLLAFNIPTLNALSKILIALVAVVLVACLVSPVAYEIGQALSGVIPAAGGFPFHRYFSRSVQVCAIIAVVPLVFWIGVRNVRELGIDKNPFARTDFFAGLLAALAPGMVLALVTIQMDVFRVRNEHEFTHLLRILLTAGFVAVIEEFLFRGVLLGLALRVVGRVWAVLITSAAFAAVHFVRPSKTAVGEVSWTSGFAQAVVSLQDMPPWPLLGYGVVTLFFSGMVLAWVTLRTRSLWPAIGLHAGWIFGQQGLAWLAKFRARPLEEFLPWIGPNLVSGAVPTGLVPLVALGAGAIGMFVYFRYGRRPSGT